MVMRASHMSISWFSPLFINTNELVQCRSDGHTYKFHCDQLVLATYLRINYVTF